MAQGQSSEVTVLEAPEGAEVEGAGVVVVDQVRPGEVVVALPKEEVVAVELIGVHATTRLWPKA